MRAVCTHWADAGKRTITRLRPRQFPVQNVSWCFPSLKSLDLSGCTKVGGTAAQCFSSQDCLPKALPALHMQCCSWAANLLPMRNLRRLPQQPVYCYFKLHGRLSGDSNVCCK